MSWAGWWRRRAIPPDHLRCRALVVDGTSSWRCERRRRRGFDFCTHHLLAQGVDPIAEAMRGGGAEAQEASARPQDEPAAHSSAPDPATQDAVLRHLEDRQEDLRKQLASETDAGEKKELRNRMRVLDGLIRKLKNEVS